ncbi:ribonuclease P/MRP protein subunit POP5-like isoform X2 [Stylophora pistillata]|uniref:ribonuclease P/MRP protein subunit POP5-like isoform X2 n=1 Tax=Stylophora pistillata TaxID=50429 RepID=UPI000C03A722|nr:ribonuclease P/MRP protein subunit POP5-like isoform X2 [Stylophora pistillata]
MVRFKKRYLLVDISCKDGKVDERIDGRILFDTVKKAVTSAHGDYGMACVARSLKGTILSCQKFLIRHNKDQLLQLLQNCKTPVERKKVLKIIKKAEKEEVSLGSVLKGNRKTTENRRKNYAIAHDDEHFDSD